MSPDAQRIAIAEACGWKLKTSGPARHETEAKMPDYLHDLNAMHEAEKILTGNQFYEYSCHIYTAACETQKKTGEWRFIGATAAQRAEAFLRTIGEWKSSQHGGAE